MTPQKQIPFLILLLHILALLAYHKFGYLGHYGFDDLHYARLANDFNQGVLDFSDHYTYRFSILFFTAICYSILGISDFASALPALLMSVSILVLVYWILKKGKLTTLILGLSLTTFSQWFIFYSDKLMPDIYVAFSVMLSLFIIHKYKFDGTKKRPILYAFLLSLALLFGFTAKGTIILFLPFLVYLFVLDMIYKRERVFWIASSISGVAVLVVYFSIIAYYTGNFASRFEAITSNSYLNLCSYDQQPLIIMIKRLAYGFVNLITSNSILMIFIFVFAIVFKKNARQYFKITDSFSFFLMAAIILFLSANFMTISPTSYIPMCLDVRHFLFLIPVAAIPAAVIITRFIEQKKHAVPIIINLFLVATLSYFLPENTFGKLYFPLIILFSAYCFFNIKRNASDIKPLYKKLFLIFFIIILLFKPLENLQYAQKVNYREQKHILQTEILDKYDHCYIITNDVQRRLGDYYLSFNTQNKHHFLSYNQFDKDSLDDRPKLLFLNWHTEYLSGLDHSNLPLYAQDVGGNSLIYENKDLNLSIYELENISVPSKEGQLLQHSLNDFENTFLHWSQNNADLTSAVKYQGFQSIQINEYSATFSFPLDSLRLESYDKIVISSNSFCYFLDKTEAELIISIENSNSAYFWKSQNINKQIHAYANWWPVKFETVITTNEIKKGSFLKIYIWNKTKQEAFLDDFEISIFGLKK